MAHPAVVRNRTGWSRVFFVICLIACLTARPDRLWAAGQDPVLEWMKITGDTIPVGTSSTVAGRQVALVSSAVFDAVNGIEPRRYSPIHVTSKAPPHASPAAAAIQAAYAILVKLYPTSVGGV
jgi:hypothetical protein